MLVITDDPLAKLETACLQNRWLTRPLGSHRQLARARLNWSVLTESEHVVNVLSKTIFYKWFFSFRGNNFSWTKISREILRKTTVFQVISRLSVWTNIHTCNFDIAYIHISGWNVGICHASFALLSLFISRSGKRAKTIDVMTAESRPLLYAKCCTEMLELSWTSQWDGAADLWSWHIRPGCTVLPQCVYLYTAQSMQCNLIHQFVHISKRQ